MLLGACDTYRAAASEQLAEWAHRANVSIEQPLGKQRGRLLFSVSNVYNLNMTFN